VTVGETLTEARNHAGLSVDELSERTRIRGTVIRGIEDDNYEECGGDLYVRGYVRAIAGAVGIDAQPLIREYDQGRGSGSTGPFPSAARPGTALTAFDLPAVPETNGAEAGLAGLDTTRFDLPTVSADPAVTSYDLRAVPEVRPTTEFTAAEFPASETPVAEAPAPEFPAAGFPTVDFPAATASMAVPPTAELPLATTETRFDLTAVPENLTAVPEDLMAAGYDLSPARPAGADSTTKIFPALGADEADPHATGPAGSAWAATAQAATTQALPVPDDTVFPDAGLADTGSANTGLNHTGITGTGLIPTGLAGNGGAGAGQGGNAQAGPGNSDRARKKRGGFIAVAVAVVIVLVAAGALSLKFATGSTASKNTAAISVASPAASAKAAAAAKASAADAKASASAAAQASAAASASASAKASQAAAKAQRVTSLPVVSATAYGPDGFADGDDPGNAAGAVARHPAQPWQSQWYVTPDFGMLKHGTGVLLDLGRKVTVTSVRLDLAQYGGTGLQVRVGNGTALPSLRVAAKAENVSGTTKLTLRHPVAAKYLLIWVTQLPPDGAGHYEATISHVVVTGRR
jgi:cytoskeletal protein RodZ